MKWSLKGFHLPTPAIIRKWAHAVNAACGTSSVISFCNDYKWFGGTLLVLTFLANLVLDGFHEDKDK